MEHIVAACHIPEDDVRDPITALTEPSRHLLIEGPVLITAVVDLHVGDNDQGLRHIFLCHMVLHGNLQHVAKCGLKIRVVRPVSHVDTANLLRKSLTLQHLDSGCSGK